MLTPIVKLVNTRTGLPNAIDLYEISSIAELPEDSPADVEIMFRQWAAVGEYNIPTVVERPDETRSERATRLMDYWAATRN
jgi:hypothetical protein